MQPHRWQPTRFLCPWDSPGKNSGVGCHFLLQCMHACILSRFSRVQPCANLWTAAYQAPPSTGFSRQEHWSGLPFPSPVFYMQYFTFMNSFNPHINLLVLKIIMPIDQMRTLKQKGVVKFDLEMKFLRSPYSKAVDLEHCVHFHVMFCSFISFFIVVKRKNVETQEFLSQIKKKNGYLCFGLCSSRKLKKKISRETRFMWKGAKDRKY